MQPVQGWGLGIGIAGESSGFPFENQAPPPQGPVQACSRSSTLILSKAAVLTDTPRPLTAVDSVTSEMFLLFCVRSLT